VSGSETDEQPAALDRRRARICAKATWEMSTPSVRIGGQRSQQPCPATAAEIQDAFIAPPNGPIKQPVHRFVVERTCYGGGGRGRASRSVGGPSA
jgi:hypothetical protein